MTRKRHLDRQASARLDVRIPRAEGDENPRLSAEWLIAEACGLSRIALYMGLDRPLSTEERAVLRDYVQSAVRRAFAVHLGRGAVSLHHRARASRRADPPTRNGSARQRGAGLPSRLRVSARPRGTPRPPSRRPRR